MRGLRPIVGRTGVRPDAGLSALPANHLRSSVALGLIEPLYRKILSSDHFIRSRNATLSHMATGHLQWLAETTELSATKQSTSTMYKAVNWSSKRDETLCSSKRNYRRSCHRACPVLQRITKALHSPGLNKSHLHSPEALTLIKAEKVLPQPATQVDDSFPRAAWEQD